MQHKLKYGVNFLRDLKLIEPKAKLEPKPKPKPEPLTLREQLEDFKKFHKIPEDANLTADFKVVDDKLSVKWRGKWVPLYGNKKSSWKLHVAKKVWYKVFKRSKYSNCEAEAS